jgi:hypothetical protein
MATVVSKINDAVEEALETQIETPPEATKEKPKDSDEVEYLVRRVSEEVTKSLSAFFPKPKTEETPTEADDDTEDSPARRKKRKAPPAQPVKKGFFDRLKFPGRK